MIIKQGAAPQIFEIIAQDEGETKTMANIARDIPICSMAQFSMEHSRFLRLTDGSKPEEAEYMIVPTRLLRGMLQNLRKESAENQSTIDKLANLTQRSKQTIEALAQQGSFSSEEKSKIRFNATLLHSDKFVTPQQPEPDEKMPITNTEDNKNGEKPVEKTDK